MQATYVSFSLSNDDDDKLSHKQSLIVFNLNLKGL